MDLGRRPIAEIFRDKNSQYFYSIVSVSSKTCDHAAGARNARIANAGRLSATRTGRYNALGRVAATATGRR